MRKRLMMCILHAGVAKLVYAPDSKSGVRQGHVGSSPTSGTNSFLLLHAAPLGQKPATKVSASGGLLRQTSAARARLDAGTSMAQSVPTPPLKIRRLVCVQNQLARRVGWARRTSLFS